MKNVVKCYKDFFDYFNALKTDCVLPSAVGYVTTILEGVHTTNSPNFGFNVFFAFSWLLGLPSTLEPQLNHALHFFFFIGSASD